MVILLAVGLLYLGFLSSRYNFDGTVFALRVERALELGDSNSIGELFHPRHMLYEPMGYLFCALAHSLGLHFRTIFLLQLMDVGFALAALALFHRMAFHLYQSRFWAGAATLLLAFAFGFWFFAIEPEVYVPEVFFLLLAFHYLLGSADPQPLSRGWVRASLGLALFGALAVLNHITLGLFLIPLGLESLLYLRRPRTGWTAGLAPALIFSAGALSLIVLAYLAASRLHPAAGDGNLLPWFLGPADPNTPYGYRMSYWSLSWRALPAFGRGWLNAFIAEPYPIPALGVPLGLKLFFLAVVGVVLTLYGKNCLRLFRQETRLSLLFLSALLPYGIWTWLWQAENFELKIALLPLLVLWAGWVLAREEAFTGRRWPAWLFAGSAALLSVYNFSAAIRPGADPEKNLDLQAALQIGQLTEPEAVVFIAGSGPGYNLGKIYLPYFSRRPAQVVDWMLGAAPPESFPAVLASELNRLRLAGQPVYLLSELLEPGPALEALGRHHRLAPEQISEFFQAYNPRRVGDLTPALRLFRLER